MTNEIATKKLNRYYVNQEQYSQHKQ